MASQTAQARQCRRPSRASDRAPVLRDIRRQSPLVLWHERGRRNCVRGRGRPREETTVGRPLSGVSIDVETGGRRSRRKAGVCTWLGRRWLPRYVGENPADGSFVDGGFLTGDFGRFDAEGNLVLTGRVSRLHQRRRPKSPARGGGAGLACDAVRRGRAGRGRGGCRSWSADRRLHRAARWPEEHPGCSAVLRRAAGGVQSAEAGRVAGPDSADGAGQNGSRATGGTRARRAGRGRRNWYVIVPDALLPPHRKPSTAVGVRCEEV